MEEKNEGKKPPHCQNSSKILSTDCRNRGKTGPPSTHAFVRIIDFSCSDTGTLINSDDVKSVLSVQASPLIEMIYSFNCSQKYITYKEIEDTKGVIIIRKS